MTQTLAIFRKEFTSYFNSLVAYFFLVLFLLIANFMFIWFSFVQQRNVVMGEYFEFAKLLFWLFIPAITMRMWSDERKLGTLELLMTMPVSDGQAVLGKFLAGIVFLAVALLISFLNIPMLLAYVGEPDWGPIIGGYLGLFLLGSSFVAIGLAISSMTENQFISFVLTSLVCVAFLGVYEMLQLIQMPGPILDIVTWIDAGSHFESIGRGVLDTRDLIYYLSLIGFFLVLNYRSVTSRRWK